MIRKKIVIVGGGPAGMAAAIGAAEYGEKDIMLIEREKEVGGILNQCIHNGFGLHTFGEELTGPEYAARFSSRVKTLDIETKTDTTVISITKDKTVTAVNSKDGVFNVQADAIVVACGCRERPRGAVNIAGARCAGIYSAGTAQKLVNIYGYLPGKEVVVLGSGDIGLIMARRMTYEGAKVKAVAEIMPFSSGLNRNIAQCLDDFGIPLLLSHTVVRVDGKERVSGVVLARVDENRQPIKETETYIPCDTLLLSVGLIPENELLSGAGVKLDATTGGAVVDDSLMTEAQGVFQCGNALHVHDLVDFVSEEGFSAGANAAAFVAGKLKPSNKKNVCAIKAGSGVRYVVPQFVSCDGKGKTQFKLRVSEAGRKVRLVVEADKSEIFAKVRPVVAPGEMETIVLDESVSDILRRHSTAEIRLEYLR